MSLINNGGKVDERFNVINVMERFGWTYQQYEARPLWFDPLYEIKLKAEAKYQEVQSKENGQ